MTISTLTNPLSVETRDEIVKHSFAALEVKEEACGFVLKDGTVIQVKNTAEKPGLEFQIAAEDSAKYLDDAQAIWHTHLNSPQFSKEDVAACKTLNLPWVMHCSKSNTFHWLDPSQDAGLLQRPWAWGLYDCYALVRDYFYQQHQLKLNDYERRFEGVWDEHDFLEFEDNWAKEGFEKVTGTPQDGDVLLFSIRSPHVNHVGVLTDVNSNVFLHHGVDRFSEQTVLSWDGFWGQRLKAVVRHRSLQ